MATNARLADIVREHYSHVPTRDGVVREYKTLRSAIARIDATTLSAPSAGELCCAGLINERRRLHARERARIADHDPRSGQDPHDVERDRVAFGPLAEAWDGLLLRVFDIHDYFGLNWMGDGLRDATGGLLIRHAVNRLPRAMRWSLWCSVCWAFDHTGDASEQVRDLLGRCADVDEAAAAKLGRFARQECLNLVNWLCFSSLATRVGPSRKPDTPFSWPRPADAGDLTGPVARNLRAKLDEPGDWTDEKTAAFERLERFREMASDRRHGSLILELARAGSSAFSRGEPLPAGVSVDDLDGGGGRDRLIRTVEDKPPTARPGKRSDSRPALRVISSDGNDSYSALGNDGEAIRTTLLRLADEHGWNDVEGFVRPFRPGKQSHAEQRRREALASALQELRANGAKLAAIGLAIGWSKQRVADVLGSRAA